MVHTLCHPQGRHTAALPCPSPVCPSGGASCCERRAAQHRTAQGRSCPLVPLTAPPKTQQHTSAQPPCSGPGRLHAGTRQRHHVQAAWGAQRRAAGARQAASPGPSGAGAATRGAGSRRGEEARWVPAQGRGERVAGRRRHRQAAAASCRPFVPVHQLGASNWGCIKACHPMLLPASLPFLTYTSPACITVTPPPATCAASCSARHRCRRCCLPPTPMSPPATLHTPSLLQAPACPC